MARKGRPKIARVCSFVLFLYLSLAASRSLCVPLSPALLLLSCTYAGCRPSVTCTLFVTHSRWTESGLSISTTTPRRTSPASWYVRQLRLRLKSRRPFLTISRFSPAARPVAFSASSPLTHSSISRRPRILGCSCTLACTQTAFRWTLAHPRTPICPPSPLVQTNSCYVDTQGHRRYSRTAHPSPATLPPPGTCLPT